MLLSKQAPDKYMLFITTSIEARNVYVIIGLNTAYDSSKKMKGKRYD